MLRATDVTNASLRLISISACVANGGGDQELAAGKFSFLKSSNLDILGLHSEGIPECQPGEVFREF